MEILLNFSKSFYDEKLCIIYYSTIIWLFDSLG